MRVRTNLSILLENKGLTRRELSRETNINWAIIQGIVAGQRIPTDSELLEICRVLECTADLIYPDPRVRELLKESVA